MMTFPELAISRGRRRCPPRVNLARSGLEHCPRVDAAAAGRTSSRRCRCSRATCRCSGRSRAVPRERRPGVHGIGRHEPRQLARVRRGARRRAPGRRGHRRAAHLRAAAAHPARCSGYRVRRLDGGSPTARPSTSIASGARDRADAARDRDQPAQPLGRANRRPTPGGDGARSGAGRRYAARRRGVSRVPVRGADGLVRARRAERDRRRAA